MLETTENWFYSQKKNDSSLETPISFSLISYLLSSTTGFSLVEWAYSKHENEAKTDTNAHFVHGTWLKN